MLELLQDDDHRRILVVVAHPDDAEYGISCAVAHWTSTGAEVSYLLLTRGENGIRHLRPELTAPLRVAEQRDACAAVGVDDLVVLEHTDGLLEQSLPLRRDVVAQIRRFRPDTVVTGTWDLEVGWGLNHADHRVAGVTTVDAIRDADNPWLFSDLGMQEWATRWLLVSAHAHPTHGVEITGAELDAGIASLAAHREYLAGLDGHPEPREFVTGLATAQGEQFGVRHGVTFRRFAMG